MLERLTELMLFESFCCGNWGRCL